MLLPRPHQKPYHSAVRWPYRRGALWLVNEYRTSRMVDVISGIAMAPGTGGGSSWRGDGADIGRLSLGSWQGTAPSGWLPSAFTLFAGLYRYGPGFWNQNDTPVAFCSTYFMATSGNLLFAYHGSPWQYSTSIALPAVGTTIHCVGTVGTRFGFYANGAQGHDAVAPKAYEQLSTSITFRSNTDVNQRTDVVLLYAGVLLEELAPADALDLSRTGMLSRIQVG